MKRTCFKTKEKKAVELISVVRSRKPFKDPIEGILHDLVITLKSKRKDFEPPTSQCFLLRKTQKSGFITIMINNNYSGLTFRPLVKHHWFPKLDDTIKIKTVLLILLVEDTENNSTAGVPVQMPEQP